MLKFQFVFFTVIMSSVVYGQDRFDLAFYCDVMNNAYEPTHREQAGKFFAEDFEKALEKPGSFENEFRNLKWVSIKYPKDKSFRLITYHINGSNGLHTYHGYIQKHSGELIKLTDARTDMVRPTTEVGDMEYWYGALYYKMMEFDTPQGKSYTLFGYNGGDKYSQIKVIDELHFDEGLPVFGANNFVNEDADSKESFSRVVIEYSDEANVNSNYNEGMGMIVHDYVTPLKGGGNPMARPLKVPDGTYVGYVRKDDKWSKIERIENQISDPESIFYRPKTEQGAKDILGRPMKSRQ